MLPPMGSIPCKHGILAWLFWQGKVCTIYTVGNASLLLIAKIHGKKITRYKYTKMCMHILGEAKPPMLYVICSSRPSNSHNLIGNLINLTYVFCYARQSSIRSNNKDAIHIHDGQDGPRHSPYHHDGKGTQHDCRATLHGQNKPHDVSDGENSCPRQNDSMGGAKMSPSPSYWTMLTIAASPDTNW